MLAEFSNAEMVTVVTKNVLPAASRKLLSEFLIDAFQWIAMVKIMFQSRGKTALLAKFGSLG